MSEIKLQGEKDKKQLIPLVMGTGKYDQPFN